MTTETIKCPYCGARVKVYQYEGKAQLARHYCPGVAGRGPRRQCRASLQEIDSNWRDDPSYQGKITVTDRVKGPVNKKTKASKT